MKKIFVALFALLAFSVPAVSHANVFTDVWDSYVFMLAGIGGQTASVADAFPRDKYIDIKVNGSDGPASVNSKNNASLRWMPRSMLLSSMLENCRISYPGEAGIVTRNVEPRGAERLLLYPVANGSSFVEFYCKRGTREFRDTVQLTVGSETRATGSSARSTSGTSGGSNAGGTVPRGWLQNIQALPIIRNIPFPTGVPSIGGSPNGIGGSVIIEMPSGQTPEEQRIQAEMRNQAQ